MPKINTARRPIVTVRSEARCNNINNTDLEKLRRIYHSMLHRHRLSGWCIFMYLFIPRLLFFRVTRTTVQLSRFHFHFQSKKELSFYDLELTYDAGLRI